MASSVSARDYRELARGQTGYAALIGVGDGYTEAVTVDRRSPDQLSLQFVSANFFQGLGLTTRVGRAFQPDDDQPGPEPVVVVSHRFWSGELNKTQDLANIRLRVNNIPVNVVGVAPASFFGLQPGQWTDIYAPLAARIALNPQRLGGEPQGEDDRDWWVRQVARVKPDIPEGAARERIAALFRNLYSAGAEKPDPARIPELVSRSASRGIEALNERESSALWILTILVGVLLLIVCANVANLLLARSVRRQRESAVRLALGGSRSRLFRQHLIEGATLALIGGGAGLFAGYGLAHAIHALEQSGRGPQAAFDIHMDARVLGYTTALSVLTALLFGLAPAIRAARACLNDTLKRTSRSVSGGLRLPKTLVSVQIALCLAALFSAGLLGRSLAHLKTVDIGFERENLVYVTVNPQQVGYTDDRMAPYIARLREELIRLPGVSAAGYVQVRPLSGNGNVSRVLVPGKPIRIVKGIVSASEAVNRNKMGPGAFEALGIPLALGRRFDAREFGEKSDAMIVDERFAQRYFPGRNPIGQRFGFSEKEVSRYEIIGVVRNSRYNTLRDSPLPVAFEPLTSGGRVFGANFAIRGRLDSAALLNEVRHAIAAVDPAVPMTQFRTQDALIDNLLRTERLLGFVSGAFSFFALALSAIGLAGLMSYIVARRTNEIGVRMAVGASARQVAALVLRDSLWMVGGGLAIGAPCAWAVAKYLTKALFELKPLDPATGALSLAVLLGVVFLAAWIPARRAAGINPVAALREE